MWCYLSIWPSRILVGAIKDLFVYVDSCGWNLRG
jgi:hypothetical protein